MNLTSTQQDWLNKRGLLQDSVLQDDTGLFVFVTSSVDGSQTKLYLPQ